MAFNPLKEKGIPIEKQFKNWDELNVAPYDKDEVHPYTRTRIILMNGIEVEGAMFGHQFARNTDDYVLKQYEGRDPESLLPSRLPTLIRFESKKDYVREILASPIDLTADGNMYKPVSVLPDSARYFAYQRLVNVDGSAPSQRVIEQHIDRHGRDYRLETEGLHPVERLRAREMVNA